MCSEHLGLPDYVRRNCSNPLERCTNLTCRNLLSGDGGAALYSTSSTFMSANARTMLPDIALAKASADCSGFKIQRGYHLAPLNEEEANFPLAFNILAHKNVDQVERLLRILYRPQNVYCIHGDAKADAEFLVAMYSIARCFDNVFLASKLERVHWAGFSRLQADVNCMKDHIGGKVRWRYLINTAAQAFPLRTNAEMVRILKIYNGANDIEGMHGWRVLKTRFKVEWVEKDTGTPEKTGRANPNPPHDIDIIRGSAYGVFSRDFVRFIINDKRATDLLQWSKKTWSPDEFYWATLHHRYSNPHLKAPGAHSGMHLSYLDYIVIVMHLSCHVYIFLNGLHLTSHKFFDTSAVGM